MATKKNQVNNAVAVAAAFVVAFVRADKVVGEGDDAVTYKKGQRMQLEQDAFDAMAKDGIVERGIYARMKTSIGGGMKLRVGDPVWLAPYVYEAWKAAGKCELSETDPQMADDLAVATEAVRTLAASQVEDAETIAALRAGWQAERLAAEAVRVEAVALMAFVSVDAKPDVVKALKALGDVLPDALVIVDDAAVDDGGEQPQMKL